VHPLAPDRVVGCRCLFTVQLILFFFCAFGARGTPCCQCKCNRKVFLNSQTHISSAALGQSSQWNDRIEH